MTTKAILLLTAIAGGAALGGLARSRARVRIPLLSMQPVPIEKGPAGATPLVSIELEPSAVIKTSQNEAIEYDFTIKPRLDAKLSTAIHYSTEFRSDSGKPLRAPTLSKVIPLSPSGLHSETITTPEDLADGYFALLVQVAAADELDDTLQIAERYFQVKNGYIVPLSSEEYFRQSAAHTAIALSEKELLQ